MRVVEQKLKLMVCISSISFNALENGTKQMKIVIFIHLCIF